MPYVNAPPGNVRLAFADGGAPARRENGRFFVSDERAKMINSMSGNGEGGLLNASSREYGARGGKPGRTCCGRLYYAFTVTCPQCGRETSPEQPGQAEEKK